MHELPLVSIITPTRNAANILGNCFDSVFAQDYPRHRYEILVVEGHSTDNTREIAERYRARIIEDQGWNMEDAKRQALNHAQGDYILFLDADNEITHPDYLKLAVKALMEHPESLGVEAYYLGSNKMTSFCIYLTELLHISDPICWLMSVKPVLVSESNQVEVWRMPQKSNAYPLGANGFLYRKADLDQVAANQRFSDTHIALYLIESGKRTWLRIKGRGVHHYYAMTLREFWRKRMRATLHYFKIKKQFQFSWLEQKPNVPAWFAALYCATLIGPFFHAFCGWIRTKDWRWWWHPLASWASLAGVLSGFYMQITHGKREDLVTSLQPTQSLKKEK
jgi:glycosyltransferase involved in cell wall biosynthesis